MRAGGNPATRAAVAGVRRHPRRTLLTGLAVLVATMFAAGAVLATGTMRDILVAESVRTPPGAAWVVDPPRDDDPGPLAARLAAVAGVTATVVGREGTAPVTVGATTGEWQVASDPGPGPMSVLPAPDRGRPPGPGEVLLGSATADRAGLAPGDPLTVAGRPLTVAGVAPLGADGADTVLLTPADAAALGPALTPVRIDVAGTPDPAALAAAAGGAQLRTAEDARAAETELASSSVTAVLAGLSVFVALAMVAAAVVVASTFRIVLGRRSRELALLRCVGASRGQVTRSVLAEAGLTGLAAGVVGTAVAVGVGVAASAAARATGVAAPEPALPVGGLAGCVLLAVAVTTAAALPPALAAGRVPPVVALGAAETSEAHRPRARRRVPLAAVLVAAAAVVAGAGVSVGDALGALGLVALSGMLLFGALVVAGPYVVSGAATVLRGPAAGSGPARLAVANARRLSRRTAATTTVLALGVGLTAALLVGIDGASAEARASIEQEYPAEVLVLVGEPGPAPEALAAGLAARPELRVRADATDPTTGMLVDGVPGTDPAAVRAAVTEATGGSGATVVWAADMRAETERVFGIVRAVGAGLVGVTLLVAVVGVGVTLALSVHERARETALLRALGLTRDGARRAVAAEAALAGTVGAVTGVVLGAGYGALGLVAIGMPVPAPPVGQLAALAAGIVVVAVVAAWAPMRRAGRVEPAHGLAAA